MIFLPDTIASIKPSWAAGFARNAAESAHPGLWNRLAGAWVPELGPTGFTIYDASGNHNNGTLTDMEAGDWAVGTRGEYELQLDAGNEYADVPGIPAIAGDVSVAMWVRVNDVTSNQYISDFGGLDEFALICGFQSGNFNLYGGAYPTGTASDSQMAMSGNSIWDHVAWVKRGTNLRGYVNGVELANVTISTGDFTPSAGLRIGVRYNLAGDMVGAVGAYYVFSRAIVQQEVQLLYRDIAAPFRLKRRVMFVPPVVGGLSIPVAMHHYTKNIGAA